MATRVFHNFDSLFIKKKFIRVARKNVTSVEEFRAAVDFTVGEYVDTSVVARYLYYRHELSRSCIMQRATYFPTAPDVIRRMTPDSATCGHKRKEDSGSRDVCHRLNKRHEAFSLQEIQIFISRYT